MAVKERGYNKNFSKKNALQVNGCTVEERTNTISLRHVTNLDEYSIECFASSSHKVFTSFLDKLRIMSSLTWNDFWKKNRQGGLELMEVDAFDDKSFIGSINVPKGTKLCITRFNSQNSRIVFRRGTKCNRVLHILGIDLNLKLYKH